MNALIRSVIAKVRRGKEWNPYKILGVRKTATAKEIRGAYRRRAKAVHSDVTGDAEEFLLLKEAHDFLLDPMARSLWDRKSIRATEEMRNRAIAALSEIFDVIVSQLAEGDFPPEHADIPDLVRKVVRSNLEDIARAEGKTKNKLRRIKLMTGKVQRSGAGENLVASIISRRVLECEGVLQKLSDKARLGDVMLAELEAYSADVEPVDSLRVDSFGSRSARVFSDGPDIRFFFT